jgi:hypothetical protein
MIEQWSAQIEKSDHQQAEIDMKCYSEELTLGTIERVILGKNYKEAREAFVAGKELQKLALYAFSDPPIPGYRYFPFQSQKIFVCSFVHEKQIFKHWTRPLSYMKFCFII